METDTDAVIENGFLRVTSMQDGNFFVTVENENGETVIFEAVFEGGSIMISEANNQ